MRRRLLLVVPVALVVAAAVLGRQHARPGDDALGPGASPATAVGLGDRLPDGVTICRGSEGDSSAQIASDPLCRALSADQAIALAARIGAASAPGRARGACAAYLGLTYTVTFRSGAATTAPLRYERCAGTIGVPGRARAVDAALLRRLADGYEVGDVLGPVAVLCPAEVVVDTGAPTPVCSDRTATVTLRVGQRLTVRAPAPGSVDPAVTLNLVVAGTTQPGATSPPPQVLDLETDPGRLDAAGLPLPDIATVRRLTAVRVGQEQFVVGADVCRVADDPCRASHLEPALHVTVTP